VIQGRRHVVGPGEDLLFLAEWYYGDSAAWSHVYWANLDLYGDDFEAIPTGSTVLIPELETKAASAILKEAVTLRNVDLATPGPGVADFALRHGEKNTSFEVTIAENGDRQLLFRFADNSELLTGPGGLAYAAERLQVDVSRLSNAQGSAGVGFAQEPYKEPKKKGVPIRRVARELRPAVPNVLRLAVEAYYGHAYMLFDVLAANGLDEADVFSPGQEVALPPRAKRGRLTEAEKWRERRGSS
jgi:hypothetical protein